MLRKILMILVCLVLFMCTATVVLATDEDDTELLPGIVFEWGDVNLDTKVNIKDATLIQKHLAKLTTLSEKQLELADVDGKAGMSIKDATHLQKWIAGIVDELFVPNNTEPTEEVTEVPFEKLTEIPTEEPTEATTEATTEVTEVLTTEPAEVTETPTEATFATEETFLTLPEVLPTEESTKGENKPIELPFVPAD